MYFVLTDADKIAVRTFDALSTLKDMLVWNIASKFADQQFSITGIVPVFDFDVQSVTV